jgi:chemotaxis protein MotB
MQLSVQGYTDNTQPGPSSPFKDNWELSTARAISVLHELILDGVNPARMSAAGFAQYHPIATNATATGREKNRRVELHFYGQKSKDNNKETTSVLDKVKK